METGMFIFVRVGSLTPIFIKKNASRGKIFRV